MPDSITYPLPDKISHAHPRPNNISHVHPHHTVPHPSTHSLPDPLADFAGFPDLADAVTHLLLQLGQDEDACP